MPELRPRLIFYLDCPVFGGADLFASYLLRHEDIRAGFEPFVVYRRNAHVDAGVAQHIDASVARVGLSLWDREEKLEALERLRLPSALRLAAKALLRLIEPLFFAIDVAALWRVFARERPALVHVNNGGYPGALGCRAAVVAARLSGAQRVVLVVHNQARPTSAATAWLDWPIDALVGRCADVMVTASSVSQDALARRGFDRAKLRVICDGVPTPTVTRPRAETRAVLGLADADVAFAVVAFFEPRKGQAVLVDAAALLSRRAALGPARFILVGDGPELEPVKARARAAGLLDRFQFLGYRRDAPDIVEACDVLVLPSIGSEDMPLSILDAMALAKPVVASHLAAIPEEVADGETGLLAPPGDAASLAAAIETLLKDRALRLRLGEAGRRRFLDRFEVSISARRYARFYGDQLGLNPSGETVTMKNAAGSGPARSIPPAHPKG